MSSSIFSALPLGAARPKALNRHSYAGPGTSTVNLQAWNTIQTRDTSPSPLSSPIAALNSHAHRPEDDDQYMFFENVPQNSSFIYSVTEGTPSPRSKRPEPSTLPRKYRPRDSGVMLTDDEEDSMSIGCNSLHTMPAASTSVGSMPSDTDDNLVTPGFAPEPSSGWPTVFISGTDDVRDNEALDVDAFIMRTLAAASKGTHEGKKRVPGTPVKKVKTTFLAGGARPWQSAVAAKIGPRFDWDTKKGKAPRQSLPTVFPPFGKKAGRLSLDQSTDSEDEEESPGQRRDKYIGLGLGRPTVSSSTLQNGKPTISRAQWLVRRSSSGTFSSGSESMSSSGTPTRVKSKNGWFQLPRYFVLELNNRCKIGWGLHATPRISSQLSPSKKAFGLSPARTASDSSSSSGVTPNSPSIPSSRRFPATSNIQRPMAMIRRLSEPFNEEQPGRFERDFLAEDEIGSGEFGKVIRVRRQNADNGDFYAVKKSKRFEGPRHR